MHPLWPLDLFAPFTRVSRRRPRALAGCLGGVLLWCSAAAADPLERWFGSYAMSHDGWRGTLTIARGAASCSPPQGCALRLRYVDAQGQERPVRADRIDTELQRLRFTIAFPGQRQPFEGYLFSHEPGRIAGTTRWNGRLFGFAAERREPPAPVGGLRLMPRDAAVTAAAGTPASATTANATPAPAPATGAEVQRRILPDGTLERRFADGSIERKGPRGWVRITPDGREMRLLMQQVMPVWPPVPPGQSPEGLWLEAHAEALLNLLVGMAPAADAATARAGYLSTEAALTSVYERIARRTDAIAFLSAPGDRP